MVKGIHNKFGILVLYPQPNRVNVRVTLTARGSASLIQGGTAASLVRLSTFLPYVN